MSSTPPERLLRALKRIADKSMDLCLSREQQERLGAHILGRVRGEGNGDPNSNGEYWLLPHVVSRFPGQPAVIFDVGANVGGWSTTMAECLSRPAKIFAFEPSAASFAHLERIAPLKNGVDFEALSLALSDTEGQSFLNVSSPTAGTNSLHIRDERSCGVRMVEQQPVTLARGDSICAERHIDSIQFVKVDTEGHELSVLRGFDAMLRDRRIDALQFEYGATWLDANSSLKEAFELLLGCGYAVGKLQPNGVSFHERYDQRLENFVFANYVAVLPGDTGEYTAV